MNYLLDRKSKRKRFLYVAFSIILFVVLFYFRNGIFYGLSYVSSNIFRPVLILGNNVKDKLGSLGAYFLSKNSLLEENEDLRLALEESRVLMLNYNSVLSENNSLKETLSRKNDKTNMILASILEKPNQSPYDTLLVDIGEEEGLETGDMVFAGGFMPIGRVAEISTNSSKIILFSTSGEKTQVVVGDNVFMEIIGRGGGNFEMILPRDFILQKGDQVTLPGITPYVVGVVETIISDPRDSFQKALLTSPVNVQELKFVEVTK